MSYNKMMRMQKPNRGPKMGGNYMGFDVGTIRPICHKSEGLAAYQNILRYFKFRHMDGDMELTRACIKESMPAAKAWYRS